MQKLTDNDEMPFGKHKGTKLANVPAFYLVWLYNRGCHHQGLKQYIEDNLDALNDELKK